MRKGLMAGLVCGFGLFVVGAHAGQASRRPAPTVLTRGEIARAFAVPRPGHTARAIAPAGVFRYWAVTRRAPGSVEIHEHWVDVIYVRAGEARLETGAAVAGGRNTGDGEWRGGRIANPRAVLIEPGDMIVIPAGLAHRFVPLGGRAFEYVTVKTPSAS